VDEDQSFTMCVVEVLTWRFVGVSDVKEQKVGMRGVLFTFEAPFKTNVFLIAGDSHVFVCDTFLGSEPMKVVKRYLDENGLGSKPLAVFNSHADYDHYWGNGSFKSSIILGHELCRRRIEAEGKGLLTELQSQKQGEVELIPPNLTFTDRVFFADEGLEFYYTPGHTADSASCFDHVDNVLFVGDNVESPLPYVNEPDCTDYVATLEEYLKRGTRIFLSGHDEMMLDDTLIRRNLEYVKSFQMRAVDATALDKRGKVIHFTNLTNIGGKLKDKGMLRETLNYYEEGKCVLDLLDNSTQGKQEQMKNIQEAIASLSSRSCKANQP